MELVFQGTHFGECWFRSSSKGNTCCGGEQPLAGRRGIHVQVGGGEVVTWNGKTMAQKGCQESLIRQHTNCLGEKALEPLESSEKDKRSLFGASVFPSAKWESGLLCLGSSDELAGACITESCPLRQGSCVRRMFSPMYLTGRCTEGL